MKKETFIRKQLEKGASKKQAEARWKFRQQAKARAGTKPAGHADMANIMTYRPKRGRILGGELQRIREKYAEDPVRRREIERAYLKNRRL